MRKSLMFLLVLLSMVMMAAGVTAETYVPPLEGLVLEVPGDGSFLLQESKKGQVLVQVSSKTRLKGLDAPAVGQYVFVWYDGTFPGSEPARMDASQVSIYLAEGAVISMDKNENTALLDSKEYGQMFFHLPETETVLAEGEFVSIYFNGAFTKSKPPEAWGRKVEVYKTANGVIVDLGDGYFLMEGKDGVVRVNMGDSTRMPDCLEDGNPVTVYYSKTEANPNMPHLTAVMIEIISRRKINYKPE